MNTEKKTCKHFGGQGDMFVVQELKGDERYCAASLFWDIDNDDFRHMPYFKVTYGNPNMGGAKGQLNVHIDFGCINHNDVFDEQ